jgi:hypothetical protein
VTILHLDQTAPDWTVRAADAHLSEGQRVHVDLTLTHGGFLSGNVLDAVTGKGIAGVDVGLYGPAHPKYSASIESRFTDNNGFYSFRTPSGKQHVYLAGEVPDGYFPRETTDAFEPTVRDGQTTTVNFKLRPNGWPSINGSVTDVDGKPIAGATVLCDDSIDPFPGGNTRTVLSDTDGRFRIAHVQPGSIIRARWKNLATEAPINVRGGTANVEIQLSPTAFYTLTVRATDENGSIIPTATVSLVVWNSGYGAGMEPKRSDLKGTIVFDSLLADTKYSLSAQSPGYGVVRLDVKTPPIGTPRQQVVSLVLKKASSVLGGIVVDQNGAAAPFAEVSINGTETGLQSAKADSHGHFEFLVVPEARHVILWAGPAMGGTVRPKTATADAGNTNIKLFLP